MLQCRFSAQGIFQDFLKPVQFPLKSVLLHFTAATLQASSALLTYTAFPFLQSRLQIYQIGSLLTPLYVSKPSLWVIGSFLYPNFLLEALILTVVILVPPTQPPLPHPTLCHASVVKVPLPGCSLLRAQPQEGLPISSVPLSQRPAEPLHSDSLRCSPPCAIPASHPLPRFPQPPQPGCLPAALHTLHSLSCSPTPLARS